MSLTTKVLAVSLILNLVLISCVALLVGENAPESTSKNITATERTSNAKPSPSETEERIHWSQIESRDYRKYVANLRAIGCPEEKIREIITADLASVRTRERLSVRTQEKITRSQEASPDKATSQDLTSRTLAHADEEFIEKLLSQPQENSPITEAIPSSNPARQFLSNPPPQILIAQVQQSASPEPKVSPKAPPSIATEETEDGKAGFELLVTETSEPKDAKLPETTPEEEESSFRRTLFTPEEEQYRRLYGWQAFEEAKREQIQAQSRETTF